MAETNPEDYKLIGILLGMGSLTPRQAQRLERAVEEGTRLEEAVARLPLVEPQEALRARRLLAPDTSGIPTSTPQPEAAPAAPRSSPRESKATIPLQRDEDGIPFLELEEVPPPPRFTPPERRLRPVAKTDTDKKTAASPPPPQRKPEELTRPSIAIAPSPEAIDPESLPRIDLLQDDDIPLVRDVVEMLAAAPRNNLGALQFAWDSVSGAIAEYARSGKRIAARENDAIETEKMAAHLLVTARLSPWKSSGQEGWIEANLRNVRFLIHLKRDKIPDSPESADQQAGSVATELLTISILEQFT